MQKEIQQKRVFILRDDNEATHLLSRSPISTGFTRFTLVSLWSSNSLRFHCLKRTLIQ